MIDIVGTLTSLAHTRPIFHSEADFQHALAWRVHQLWPDYSVRLEFRPPEFTKRVHLDIWAIGHPSLAIELKYKTRGLRANVGGELFELRDQSAQDIGRYDFLNDVQRVEQVVSSRRGVTGYAILLTNDSAYWRPPRSPGTIDAEFRIHQGRLVTGDLAWGAAASDGTMKGREAAIALRGSYALTWRDYSEPVRGRYGKFRYLLLTAQPGTHAHIAHEKPITDRKEGSRL